MMRYMERYHSCAYRVLMTVRVSPDAGDAKRAEAIVFFRKMIRTSLRSAAEFRLPRQRLQACLSFQLPVPLQGCPRSGENIKKSRKKHTEKNTPRLRRSKQDEMVYR